MSRFLFASPVTSYRDGVTDAEVDEVCFNSNSVSSLTILICASESFISRVCNSDLFDGQQSRKTMDFSSSFFDFLIDSFLLTSDLGT